jgi:hypothetical protein
MWSLLPTLCIVYGFAWTRLDHPSKFSQVFGSAKEFLYLRFGTNPQGYLQSQKKSSVMAFVGEWVHDDAVIPVQGMRIKELNATRYQFHLPDGGKIIAREVTNSRRCEPDLQYQRYRSGRKVGEGTLTAGFCP